MKSIILLLFITHIGFSSCNRSNITDLTNQRLIEGEQLNNQKNFKSVTTIVYDAKQEFDKLMKGKLIEKTVEKFSVKGILIDKSTFDENCSLCVKDSYDYYDNGKLKKKIHIVMVKHKLDTTIIEFASDGGILKKTNDTEDYDNKGNIIRTGKLGYHTSFGYNQNSKLISDTSFSSGKIFDINNYSFNDIGQKSEAIRYLYGKPDKKTIYQYDNRGLLIKENYIKADGKPDLIDEIRYRYNSHGNVIEMIKFWFIEVLIYKYEYEYDEYGNWVRKIDNRPFCAIGGIFTGKEYDGSPEKITERQIEYYR